jgi:KAP family P-loop domain
LGGNTVAATGQTGRAVQDQAEPHRVGAASDAADSSNFQILADTPIDQDEQDLLGFGAYADALAELLDHPATSTPLTVAITGPWGSGKTSLAKMVDARLRRWPKERGDPEHILCWFNAWLHDDAPNLGAAFAAEVARVAAHHRPLWQQVLRPLPTRMLPAAERWRRRLVLLVLCLLLLVLVVALQRRWADDAVGRLAEALGYQGVAGIAAVVLLVVVLWGNLASIAQTAGRFLNDPAGEAAKGSVNHVRSQLRELVHQATDIRPSRRRLVIFVDDLERCTPPRAVEVCEKAYQLFGHRAVAVVLIADISSLAASAKLKHGSADVPIYGERYLQKIVQIQFDLPPVRPDVMRSLLKETAVRRRIVRTPPEEATLTSPVREARRRLVANTHRGGAYLRGHPWELAGLIFLATVASVVIINFVPESSSIFGLLVMLMIGLFGLLALLVMALVFREIFRFVERLQSRFSRARIDQEIQARATGHETDSKQLASEVLKTASASRASGSLVERRVQRYLVEASDSRREAEAELLRNPPDLPRDAKRMINQLRVLLAVALNRGMLTPNGGVTGAHLGQWIVLQSRWPDVGHALAVDPARLEQVEACATSDDLRSLLSSIGVQVADSDELLRFLQADPTLCRVLSRLLRYAPATVN